jgi:glycosyltransferase involved in cell wall biosynthesis
MEECLNKCKVIAQKSNNPIISIIVPVFNVEKYICKCIDSILEQTFTDFELILVGGGSNDKSEQICDEYALKDKRIKVIHTKKNYGLSYNRNAGLDEAVGEYVAFVDSDDWISPDMYKILYEYSIKYSSM